MKLLLLFLTTSIVYADMNPFPIQFSISETKIVDEIPMKDQDFAFIIPGQLETYIFDSESEYYNDYQRSYFAVTCKKAGWDCMRHYEILANGCIPYFLDLDSCPKETMHFLPKELIKQAMNLEGVSYRTIDHEKFDKEKYFALLNQLLEHTRTYLSTRKMAHHVLGNVNYSGKGKILYLSGSVRPDYMRETTLIGLREVLGDRLIDFPKIDFLYQSYPATDAHKLYGKGFSYTRVLDDAPLDRENIVERIMNKEFECIIYGSVHRGLPYHEIVTENYDKNHIFYICGEDAHICEYRKGDNLFLREF